MVAGVFAGNISDEATTPTGNTLDEAMRGILEVLPIPRLSMDPLLPDQVPPPPE